MARFLEPYEFVRQTSLHSTEDGEGLVMPEGFTAVCATLYSEASIRVRGGRSMSVYLHRRGLQGRMEFGSGWTEVVDHYRIKGDDKLYLSYDGGLHFDLLVVGPHRKRRAYYETERCGCYIPQGQVVLVGANAEVGGNAEVGHGENDPGIDQAQGVVPNGCCGTFVMSLASIPTTRSQRGSQISPVVDVRSSPFLRRFGSRTWQLHHGTNMREVNMKIKQHRAFFTEGWEGFVNANGLRGAGQMLFQVFDSPFPYMVVQAPSLALDIV